MLSSTASPAASVTSLKVPSPLFRKRRLGRPEGCDTYTSSRPSPSASPTETPWCPMPPGMNAESIVVSHSSSGGTSCRANESLRPNVRSVTSAKRGAEERLRRWSTATHSATCQVRLVPRRHASCQWPSRCARQPLLARPVRSKRTVVRARGSGARSTSMAVIRSSAVSIASKSLTRALSSLRKASRSRTGCASMRGAREISSRGLLPIEILVGRRQASTLELRRQQPVGNLGCAARALAKACAHLTQTGSELLRFLLVGKRVAAGDEVLLDRFERRWDAELGMVAIDLRATSDVSCEAHVPGPHTTSVAIETRSPIASARVRGSSIETLMSLPSGRRRTRSVRLQADLRAVRLKPDTTYEQDDGPH